MGSRSEAGQLHECFFDGYLTFRNAPYGADRLFRARFPALKRWANNHCAYGAFRTRRTRSTKVRPCDCHGLRRGNPDSDLSSEI